MVREPGGSTISRLPPNPFGVGPDGTVLGSFRSLGEIVAEAIVTNGIERVVQLAVLDVHPTGGAGDIPAGVAAVESMLEAAAPSRR